MVRMRKVGEQHIVANSVDTSLTISCMWEGLGVQ